MTAAVYDLMDYDDVLEKYDPVMGMEVHVELGDGNQNVFRKFRALRGRTQLQR